MGPPARVAVDLPDPLDSSEAPQGDGEDLMSELAGDAVNRMMSDDSLEPIRDDELADAPPGIAVLNPVQELTSQLDTFFEELRVRQEEVAAAIDAIPEANPIGIDDLERAALDAPTTTTGDDTEAASSLPPIEPKATTPRDLIAQYESKKTTPWLLRPFDRGGAVVERLSPVARFFLSATAVLSFLSACAALVYVLMLRRM